MSKDAVTRGPDREAMLRAIEADARETGSLTGRPKLARRTLDAMRRVAREDFVSPAQAPAAYENAPLPIGNGQTISQPFIVALMTDLLDLPRDASVLEVGAGCGYQAAVLAALGATVRSIEIVAPLAREAAARLARLGYERVHVKQGDGYLGWPEHAPFDGILVTAAAPVVPPPLVAQLKPGAKLIIPVGPAAGTQSLLRIVAQDDGSVAEETILPVAFVPLTGIRSE